MASFKPEIAKITANGPQVVIGATGVIEDHNCRQAMRRKYLFIAWLNCCQRLSGRNDQSVYFVFVIRLQGKGDGLSGERV